MLSHYLEEERFMNNYFFILEEIDRINLYFYTGAACKYSEH